MATVIVHRRNASRAAAPFALSALCILIGVAAVGFSGTSSLSSSSSTVALTCSLATLGLAIVALLKVRRQAGLISGLGVVSFFFAWTFALRALYLIGAHASTARYAPPSDAYNSLNSLNSQELVLFFNTYPESLARGLNRSTALGFLFFVAVLAAYAFVGTFGSQAPRRRRRPVYRDFTVSATLAMVGVSLLCQAAIVAHNGGLRRTANLVGTQDALALPFYYYVGVSAAPVALCMYFATRSRLSGLSKVWLGLLLAEVTVFSALTGSRSRALLPLGAVFIVYHFTRRRFTTRQIVTTFAVVLFVASAFLVVRQAAQRATFSQAVSTLTHRGPDVGVLLNDDSTLDSFVEASTLGPSFLGNHPGQRLIAGLEAAIPSTFDKHKPPTTDVWFRERVWGNQFLGGRPITVVGELWLDFGALGVLVGGLLLGFLLARLDSMAAGLSRADRGPRVVATAFTLVLLWTLLGGGFSLFVGQWLLYGVAMLLGLAFLKLAAGRPATGV